MSDFKEMLTQIEACKKGVVSENPREEYDALDEAADPTPPFRLSIVCPGCGYLTGCRCHELTKRLP